MTPLDLERHAAVCPSEEQLLEDHPTETDGQHRDRVIMSCIKAINLKYGQFTAALSREAGTTILATDILSQSLATAASVVGKEAMVKKLAAGSALSLGVGAAVNRDLFYKQTLPAIVSSMEARRSKVLTGIARAQNADPDAKVYTLARAGFDLDLLQEAGSLTSAVAELNSAAAQNAARADAERQQAERTLDIGTAQAVSPDVDARLHSAAALVRKLESANREQELRNIASSLGIPVQPGDTVRQLSALIRIEAAKVTTLAPDQQDPFLRRIEGSLAPYKETVQ